MQEQTLQNLIHEAAHEAAPNPPDLWPAVRRRALARRRMRRSTHALVTSAALLLIVVGVAGILLSGGQESASLTARHTTPTISPDPLLVAQNPTAQPTLCTVTTLNTAQVRKLAGSGATIVALAPAGQEMAVIDSRNTRSDTYYMVSYQSGENTIKGWVEATPLQRGTDCPPTVEPSEPEVTCYASFDGSPVQILSEPDEQAAVLTQTQSTQFEILEEREVDGALWYYVSVWRVYPSGFVEGWIPAADAEMMCVKPVEQAQGGMPTYTQVQCHALLGEGVPIRELPRIEGSLVRKAGEAVRVELPEQQSGRGMYVTQRDETGGEWLLVQELDADAQVGWVPLEAVTDVQCQDYIMMDNTTSTEQTEFEWVYDDNTGLLVKVPQGWGKYWDYMLSSSVHGSASRFFADSRDASPLSPVPPSFGPALTFIRVEKSGYPGDEPPALSALMPDLDGIEIDTSYWLASWKVLDYPTDYVFVIVSVPADQDDPALIEWLMGSEAYTAQEIYLNADGLQEVELSPLYPVVRLQFDVSYPSHVSLEFTAQSEQNAQLLLEQYNGDQAENVLTFNPATSAGVAAALRGPLGMSRDEVVLRATDPVFSSGPVTLLVRMRTEAAMIESRVSPDGAIIMGSDDAPVTLQVWQSFSCPHCKEYHLNDLALLLDAYGYVAEGLVQVEIRHIPSGRETLDTTAAALAYCAAEQGRYWQVANGIYGSNPQEIPETPLKLAIELGLRTELAAGCEDTGPAQQYLDFNRNLATEVGITGIPTVRMRVGDGEWTKVPRDFQSLSAAINAALN